MVSLQKLENVILEGDSMQTVQAVKDKDCKGLAGNIISGIILELPTLGGQKLGT